MDQPLTFSSHLTGGIPANINPAYTWSVSAGRIIEGQGTDTIKIDSTKDAGSGGGTQTGCTAMTSSDGCTQTVTCMQDNMGYSTTITIVTKIDSDTQFTTTTTSKTVADDGGAVQSDCTTVGTAVKM